MFVTRSHQIILNTVEQQASDLFDALTSEGDTIVVAAYTALSLCEGMSPAFVRWLSTGALTVDPVTDEIIPNNEPAIEELALVGIAA